MRRKILYKLIIISGILLIGFSFAKLYNFRSEYKENSYIYEEIKNDVKVSKENGLSKVDLEKLKKENDDFVFWIVIPNTKVDYPVVQGRDNSRYLHTNFKGNENKGGTLFVDYINNISEDKNIIIHGHNMRDGSMFGTLKNITNEDKKIYIFRDEKIYEYEIFSVYRGVPDDNTYKNVFNDLEFDNYIYNSLEKSIYEYNVDNMKENNILTLSTCTNVQEDERLIINAKLIGVEGI